MLIQLKQTITAGGTQDEQERIWRICRYSNDQAQASYGLDFLQICEARPDILAEIDLLSVEVCGRLYPMLLNGNNAYQDLSNRALRLSDTVEIGLAANMMMVIPEPIRLLRRAATNVGLSSALSNRSKSASLAIVDAETIIPDRANRSDLIRAYDSHPSSGTYFLCMDYILKFIGHGNLSYEIIFNNSRYKCDLAERFISKETNCVFAGWQHQIADLSVKNDQNTGIHHLFYNENAPLKGSLLLIGDSHSCSALAPMLSNVIEQVRFIWASRRDGYAPFYEEINEFFTEANFVVEEVSERFFLKNFCVATEEVNDAHVSSSAIDGGERSALAVCGIEEESIKNYIENKSEIERAHVAPRRTINVLPTVNSDIAEANFRAEALHTVLSAVLASIGWRGLDRRKFKKMIIEAGRHIPNSGPAAVQHEVLLAATRRVLGLLH